MLINSLGLKLYFQRSFQKVIFLECQEFGAIVGVKLLLCGHSLPPSLAECGAVLVIGTHPRIRIRSKMSRIRNTVVIRMLIYSLDLKLYSQIRKFSVGYLIRMSSIWGRCWVKAATSDHEEWITQNEQSDISDDNREWKPSFETMNYFCSTQSARPRTDDQWTRMRTRWLTTTVQLLYNCIFYPPTWQTGYYSTSNK
jgi:hypothetical protein